MTSPLGLFFADPLLDEVLCGADGIWGTADGHPTVARPRRINPFFRDLDVGPTKMLDFQQRLAART